MKDEQLEELLTDEAMSLKSGDKMNMEHRGRVRFVAGGKHRWVQM